MNTTSFVGVLTLLFLWQNAIVYPSGNEEKIPLHTIFHQQQKSELIFPLSQTTTA